MEIHEKSVDGVLLLSIRGDFLCEPDQLIFQDRIRALAASGQNHIVIDLGRVKFVNSCCLGSLVSALTTLRRANGDLRIVGVNETVMKILSLTRLDKILAIYPSLDEALKTLHAHA